MMNFRLVHSLQKWIYISAAIVILGLLIGITGLVWTTGNSLGARLKMLRKAGEPVELADFAKQPIPEERNAETYFRRTLGDLDAFTQELLALYPQKNIPSHPPAQEEQVNLDKLLSAHPTLMPVLEQAANAPDYDPQIKFERPTSNLLDTYQKRVAAYRDVYRFGRTRAGLLIAQGNRDEALSTHLMVLQLIRHWQQDPLMMRYLVTSVLAAATMEGINQVLQSGTISDSSRKALDEELARYDSMDALYWALRSERVFSLCMVDEMPGAGKWFARGLVNATKLDLLDAFDRHIQDVSVPAAEVFLRKPVVPSTSRWPIPYRSVARLIEPALLALRDPTERVRAMARSLRVLNALQIRRPPGEQTPPKLDELGLPADVILDPYTSKPLTVKRLPDGWLIYSVGHNLADDGGKFERFTDVGVGPMRKDELKRSP